MPAINLPTTSDSGVAGLPTFLEHIRELRARILWVVGTMLVASSAAYGVKDWLLLGLLAPLHGQSLHYLTPVGGLGFLLKACVLAGMLVSMPIAAYHLYRYVQPVAGRYIWVAWRYAWAAGSLALAGALFAYYVSLPAALHFLGGMDLAGITALLTADSYLTFVASYVLGSALLFQIPLVLLIINRLTPLGPRTLLGYERHVVVAAFIAAAVLSPTPDVVNQALLAAPVIILYQIGIGVVWWANRSVKRKAAVVLPKSPMLKEKRVAGLTRQTYVAQSAVPGRVSTPACRVLPGHRAQKRRVILDFASQPSGLKSRNLRSSRVIGRPQSSRVVSIDGIL